MRRVEGPSWTTLLVDSLAHKQEEAGPKPTALGTRIRHSDAAGCDRMIGLKALAVEPSDGMDLAGVWDTSLGTLIHEAWQAAAQEALGEWCEIEVKVSSDPVDASGHVDAVIRTPEPKVIAYELKTMNGTGFGFTTGIGRSASGPRLSAIVQASLNALSVNADEAVIGIIAKECVSKPRAAKLGLDEIDRFTAEYVLTRAEYEPIALAEKARWADILEWVDSGNVPGRFHPIAYLGLDDVSEEPLDPHKAAYPCGYCNYRTLCLRLGDNALVSDVKEIASV